MIEPATHDSPNGNKTKLHSALNPARWDETLVGGVLVVMMAIGLLGVFMRYVVQAPLTWSGEVSRFLLVWLTFIGALAAVRQDSHIKLTANLLGTLSPRLRIGVSLALDLLTIAFLIVLVVQGARLAEVVAPTVLISVPSISLVFVYGIVPLTAIIMVGQLVFKRVSSLLRR